MEQYLVKPVETWPYSKDLGYKALPSWLTLPTLNPWTDLHGFYNCQSVNFNVLVCTLHPDFEITCLGWWIPHPNTSNNTNITTHRKVYLKYFFEIFVQNNFLRIYFGIKYKLCEKCYNNQSSRCCASSGSPKENDKDNNNILLDRNLF